MRFPPADAREFSFALTDDALLGGRLQLLQPARGHRAGHDAVLLAAAAPNAQHAIDLGAGIGTAGLALLARSAAHRVTMVEIDAELARLAELNAERNGFAARVNVVTVDVERLASRGASPAAASADLVIMNPPFNDPARRRPSPQPARRRAHAGSDAQLGLWIAAAGRLLKSNGRLALIHRPETLTTILALLSGKFGAIELIPIQARAQAPAIRILVRAQKGKRTPLLVRPPFVLADDDGRPSAAAQGVLRAEAPLDPA